MEKWEDINVISENQLPSHATLRYEKTLDLNGIWKFDCILDPDRTDPDFLKEDYDDAVYYDIPVPSCWETQSFGKPYYYGADFPPAINKNPKKIPSIDHKQTYCGLYRRKFRVDASYLEGQSVLRFDSVKSAFECYLNGEYAGMAKGSMLPCEFDVTSLLKEGENTLAVRVLQFSDETYLEDQDMWFLSGIYRDVSLYNRPKTHLEDVYLHSELTNDYRDAVLRCDVKAAGEGTVRLVIDGKETEAPLEDGKASLSLEMKDVLLWSAEKPDLYSVTVELKDGEETEKQDFRFGFREDRVDHEKALYLHNGKPVKLRGVNYHAFSPDKGYTVPEELYRKDLTLMKKANFNAIRTSHYPQDDVFYDLCDEMGFYVMDECNVETHGVRDKNVPGDDPKWTKPVVDRMERMVLRDRNHACVSLWSLGNESACGENHFRMKEATLKLDSSRPIHYEGGRNLKLSDFLCDGYCSTERERHFANKEDVIDKPSIVQRLIPLLMSLNSITYEEYKNHPILVTEYNHCMGNVGSDVEEHIRIMDKADHYCGGFVWDFKDKSLLKDRKLTYGGDWGVKDQAGDFCCNGVTDPFSRPHSVYYEIQHAFQPVVIEKGEGNTISVYNRNFFTSTKEYRSYFTVEQDGKEILRKDFDTDAGPREKKDYELPYEVPEKGDVYLNIFFEKEDSSAYQQFCLRQEIPEIPSHKGEIVVREDSILMDGKYVIDRKTGDVKEILVNGKNILKTPLRPSLYRPYTDGDLGFIGLAMKRHLHLDDFGKTSIRGFKKKPVVKVGLDGVAVTDTLKDLTLTRHYSVSEGKLHVEASLTTGKKKAPNRFGFRLELDRTFDRMDYFGKGPSDHYAGKDDSDLVSIHHQDIADQDEYVRPQEHGQKTHVAWAKVSSSSHTLMIERGKEELNVSMRPYTLKDLHEAQHIYELPEHTLTNVNIDMLQNGLSDCFVKCDEKYLIKPQKTYTYDFCLSIKKI